MFHKLDSEMSALLENMFSDGLVQKTDRPLREIMDLCNVYLNKIHSNYKLYRTLDGRDFDGNWQEIITKSRTVRGVRARSARSFFSILNCHITHIITITVSL